MIYNFQIDTIKPFMQYRKSRVLSEFMDIYTKQIQGYFDYLNEAVNALTLREPTAIIPQLAYDYYGLPFLAGGGTTSNIKYDTEKLYDSGYIYDDNDTSASVRFEYLYEYLKFLYDYNTPIFNVDMIMSFFAKFCDCQKADIDLKIENKFTLHFYLPQNERAQALIQIQTSMNGRFYGFPYANNLGENIIKISIIGA